MHNTYRQILALTFFMAAFGLAKDRPRSGLFVYTIAFFTHNSIALLFPLFLLIANNFKLKKYSIIMLFITSVLLYLSVNSTNEYFGTSAGLNVGERIAYIYLLALIVIGSFVFVFEYIVESRSNKVLIQIIAILFMIYLSAFFILQSQGAERVFKMIMAILFPLLGLYFEQRFKPKTLVRLLYFHLTISPLFFVYNEVFPTPL